MSNRSLHRMHAKKIDGKRAESADAGLRSVTVITECNHCRNRESSFNPFREIDFSQLDTAPNGLCFTVGMRGDLPHSEADGNEH